MMMMMMNNDIIKRLFSKKGFQPYLLSLADSLFLFPSLSLSLSYVVYLSTINK